MEPKRYALGIDIGNQTTCTSVYRNGAVEIIPHEGHRSMPSWVAFTESERLVGAAAKSQAGRNPKNTIFNVLRMIGLKFSSLEIQTNMKHWPFKVLQSERGLAISVDYKGDGKIFTPVEILSMIISRAKDDAEKYLDAKVVDATVSIPSYFNSSQRQAIKDAACIAGLDVLRLASGPVATCIDYAISSPHTGERSILVVDCGAGKTDVAIATVEDGVIDVLSVASDLYLGGEDFDNRLVNHSVTFFKRKHKKDLTTNSRALLRLRIGCEALKRELSSRTGANIQINSIHDGIDFDTEIYRARFEDLCQDLFRSIIEPIERALKGAGRDKLSIDEIVVVGGSSRIPKVQRIISDFFDGKEVSKFLSSDESGARGLANLAVLLSGLSITSGSKLNELTVLDVAPLSIGIESAGGVMNAIIKRNATIPTRKSEIFSFSSDNQEIFTIRVFEGDRARTKDNNLIGSFSIPIISAPRGESQVEILLDYDAQGTKTLTANEKPDGTKHTFLLNQYERLSSEDIDRMITELAMYKADDEAEAERVSARIELEHCAFALKNEALKYGLSNEESRANIITNWMEDNCSAAAWEYHQRQEELEKILANLPHRRENNEEAAIATMPLGDTEASSQMDNEQKPQEIQDPSALDITVSQSKSPGHREGYDSATVKPSIHSTNELGDKSPSSSEQVLPVQSESFPNLETRSQTPSSDVSTPNDGGLRELFSTQTSEGEPRTIYTDAELTVVSTYLRNTGRSSWSSVPRLYTLLRIIGQLSMLETFVEQGITDIWFPFTSTSLPDSLPPSVRTSFLESQSVVLSKSLRFEKSLERKHAHFAHGEPLPFEVIAILGSGAHGFVHKVVSNVSHREYARKLFRRHRRGSKEEIKSFMIELQVLKKINHLHCVELVQSYTDAKYFALLMSPVADCNLSEYYSLSIDSPDKLSLLRSFFGCLAHALRYLHDIKIRHRDIKPQNILVKGDRVFFTDFGIALDWEHLSRSTTTADSGKTWMYAAPEVVKYEKRNTSSDIWGLGCVYLEMTTVLNGVELSKMRDYFNERSGTTRIYANIDIIPEWIEKIRKLGNAKDSTPLQWIAQILKAEPELRPTAAQLASEIVFASTHGSGVFCGPCCMEDVDSSDGDHDDDDLWRDTGDLTIKDA